MRTPLFTLLLAAITASLAWGAPPAPFPCVIVRAADADTLVCEKSDHSQVKVRLFAIDCPEVAHKKREKDQPGGQEALAYVQKNWQGKEIIVTPKGQSYGRIVAEVVDAKTQQSLGLDLVSRGHAEVDQRYSKSKLLLAAESAAKEKRIGLWQNKSPVHPWDWRKKQRARAK